MKIAGKVSKWLSQLYIADQFGDSPMPHAADACQGRCLAIHVGAAEVRNGVVRLVLDGFGAVVDLFGAVVDSAVVDCCVLELSYALITHVHFLQLFALDLRANAAETVADLDRIALSVQDALERVV